MAVATQTVCSTAAIAGHVSQQQAKLSITQLENDVHKYFECGLAENTKKSYKAGINKFNQFCILYNVTTPLPVSQSLLCSFISYLAKAGQAYSTIKMYLSAIRHLHIANGLPEPRSRPMPKLELVERSIRRLKSRDPPRRIRLPITPVILR